MLFRQSIAHNEGPDLWLGVAIQSNHHFNIKEYAVITIMPNLSFNQSWVRLRRNGPKLDAYANTVTG